MSTTWTSDHETAWRAAAPYMAEAARYKDDASVQTMLKGVRDLITDVIEDEEDAADFAAAIPEHLPSLAAFRQANVDRAAIARAKAETAEWRATHSNARFKDHSRHHISDDIRKYLSRTHLGRLVLKDADGA